VEYDVEKELKALSLCFASFRLDREEPPYRIFPDAVAIRFSVRLSRHGLSLVPSGKQQEPIPSTSFDIQTYLVPLSVTVETALPEAYLPA